MRKLKLDPEDLRIESFEAVASPDVRGTVLPNEGGTKLSDCCTAATVNCDSCYVSCNHSACPMDCETEGDACGPIYVSYEAATCDYVYTCLNQNTCVQTC
jgi:hypothetical protein